MRCRERAAPIAATATRPMLLGGRAPASFLRALLAEGRAARPRRAARASPASSRRSELFALAQRDDVESRLVVRDGAPLVARARTVSPRRSSARCRARNWTLLVQGVNLHSTAADALLRRFAFLPYARLDDLMVSYAAPGGGVGPHFDSYDVFLLQGSGRRRWRYGRQDDLALKPRAAAQDPAPLHARARRTCSRPATCSTCRRSTRTTASRVDRVHDVFDRIPRRRARPSSRPRSSISCATSSTSPDATPIRICAPTREPARIGAAMQRRMRGDAATASAGTAPTVGALPRLLAVRAEAQRVLRPAGARRCRARRFALAAAQARRALDPRTQLLYDDARSFVNGATQRWPGRAQRRCARASRQRARASRRATVAPRAATPSRFCTTGIAMATSTPTPADAAPAPATATAKLLDTVAAQVAAIDELIGLARALDPRVRRRSLARWAGTPRRARRSSARSCAARRTAKLEIIVHDTRWIEASCPRLIAPAETFTRRDHGLPDRRRSAKRAMDPLVIVDGRHFLHRFHIEQPRAALAIEEPHAREPLVDRFDEIWATGEPGSDGHGARTLTRAGIRAPPLVATRNPFESTGVCANIRRRSPVASDPRDEMCPNDDARIGGNRSVPTLPIH